ncbi:alpha/beta hydrolase [Aquibacillus koreensis]|uniref:Alpha/beta hydrolase n=1 Tax=Aquibacillus koreensis TaxID=279446 RepID=A0A9X4AIB9_9BACI|nr:alpha/beta hydrolase [Aquibacillus koreensis]MCT2535138.1 alpha/beta hydrolase [Aquibacillus koreensis]MDC3420997.1 alpha/beta hydrolase [Aquibacillus koreensis]
MPNYQSIIIGKGKPLIFLPAFGFSGKEGLNIADALSNTYECHLLDLPGIGKSEGIKGKVSIHDIAIWLKQYVDQCRFDAITLIGHSMGGAVAMCFASIFSENVEKLVLLDQGHIIIPRFPTKEFGVFGYLLPIISVLERTIGKPFVKLLHKFYIHIENNGTKELFQDELKEFCQRFHVEESDYIREALKEDVVFTQEGLRLYFGYYRLNLPQLLQQITSPCLLIYASYINYDPERATKTKEAVKRLVTKNNVTLLKLDSHHYVHWSGEECLKNMKKFL